MISVRLSIRRSTKLFVLAVSCVLCVGCVATLEERNGELYYGDSKVRYGGELEAVRVFDQNHQPLEFRKGQDGLLLVDRDNRADLGDIVALNTSGGDAAGPGVIELARLAFYALVMTKEALVPSNPDASVGKSRMAPTYSELLIRMPEGDLKTLSLMNDVLERQLRFGCIEVGEPVLVVAGYRNASIPVHGDVRLQRRSALQPSCSQLRERYGYLPAQLEWD